MKKTITLLEISQRLCLEAIGENREYEILNLCNASSQYQSVLSYVTSQSLFDIVKMKKNITGLFITLNDLDLYKTIDRNISFIVSESPEYDFYRLHDLLCSKSEFYTNHDNKSSTGENCHIHATATIESGVRIGSNVKIGPNTVVRSGSVLENDITIGCNSVIGSEGFQVLRHNNRNIIVKHVGGIKILEGVNVGDGTMICKSLFEGYTLIGKNTKIDNLVHVAHNCIIGDNVVIGGGVVFCGSCIVEDCVWIGPNSSVLNRVTIGSGSLIGLGSKVLKSIPRNTKYYSKTENVAVAID